LDRRTFNKLAGFAGIGALTGNLTEDAEGTKEPAHSLAESEVVLEDETFRIAFDAASGALVRLEQKRSAWRIQRRRELGVSFRLHAPLRRRRDNFVLGHKQKAVKVEKSSDRRVALEWKNLISEHGEVLPITFSASVALDNGALTFTGTLDNDSRVTVESIEFPYIGDFSPNRPNGTLHTEHMWYGNLVQGEIYPHFNNATGYWGVRFPRRTIDSRQSLFCLIQAADEGLYVGMHDASVPYLSQFTFEQHPGVLESITNPVPRQDDISQAPVHLEVRACHFVFASPHSTKVLAPIVLHSYAGDWHAGLDVYKTWRASWFKSGHLPDWVGDVHSWQQLQIDGAEEDFSIAYKDLGHYVHDCATNGVRAIQLVGWNRGGQDRGDPSQDTDPGLGTWQELRDAIRRAQSLGVQIILFAKLNWADLTTAGYKQELYKYAATDPYGIPYQHGGYSYTTPTQLAGINNRRRAVMDTMSSIWRDIATREFQKLLDLGAAGWLFDEVCHHGPVEYSFSPDHGYAPPGYIYAGDIPMAKQFRAAADQVNPNFVFAGEGPQDWLMQYYPVSYFRINASSRPVCRYIDSQAPLMIAVTGFDDREMLNLALLYRYIISYEPYNFKGRLSDFPLTLDYGKKIDELRRQYRSFLWDAQFRDTLGVEIECDGAHRYSVFVARSGRRAVVVVNQEHEKTITAHVELPDAGPLVLATPEQPQSRPSSATLEVPSRTAAVLMEQ
jgi:hypothetical protein